LFFQHIYTKGFRVINRKFNDFERKMEELFT